MPTPALGVPLAEHLHQCACVQLKQHFLQDLMDEMILVMQELKRSVAEFEPLLVRVRDSLRTARVDSNIRSTYGSYMQELVLSNEALLNSGILPCDEESELLEQLESTFRQLVESDPRRIYYASLQEDIQFQIDRGVAAATCNIIDACFSFNMESAGRLLSYTRHKGNLFCIMNNQLTQQLTNISASNIGERFISNRSDRIERLFLYAMDADSIMYN
jgi:hypothetical protein